MTAAAKQRLSPIYIIVPVVLAASIALGTYSFRYAAQLSAASEQSLGAPYRLVLDQTITRIDNVIVDSDRSLFDLVDLEQQIALMCPGIAEAAAIAAPDADGVDAVALFFVAQPDAPVLDAATLREHADRLPPYQRPRWLHPIEALPRTPTGKLVRRRLRDLHATIATEASTRV